MSRILVVDHDPSSVAVTARLLTEGGHQVREVTDAEQAQSLAEAFQPHLILLGLRPGDVDQSLLVRAIRSSARLSETFIVAISSTRATAEDYRRHKHEGGVDGFVTRPVSDAEYLSRIEGYLELQRVHTRLRASEKRFRTLVEQNADGMVIVSGEGRIMLANDAAAALLGRRADDLEGQEFGFPVAGSDYAEIEIPNPSGHHTILQMRVVETEWKGEPVWLTSLRDVTEHYQTQEALRGSNRALRLVSACNEALLEFSDEKSLFREICRIATELGEYQLAWIGMQESPEGHWVEPVCWAGNSADTRCVSETKLSWRASDPAGQSDAGQALRAGRPVVFEDTQLLPDSEYWAEPATQCGYRTVICLPLSSSEGTFGVLCFYQKEPQKVSQHELDLLQRLSENLAFGIRSIWDLREKLRVQQSVLKVASGVSAVQDNDFFAQLCENMNEALGSIASFVSRLIPGETASGRTLAVVAEGERLENFDYRLEQTPCDYVLSQGQCVIEDDLVEQFPQAQAAGWPAGRAYLGWRLDNSAGQPIGFIAVLFAWPIRERELLCNTMRIFSSRAAAELERRNTDVRIRDQASLLDKAQDAIIVIGIDQRVLYWNKSAELLYGWDSHEAFGCTLEALVGASREVFSSTLIQVVTDGDWSGEMTHHHRDGKQRTVEGRWTLVRDEDERPQSILVINTDITHRKAQEREIEKLAFFDALTGLPNRRLLVDRLQRALVAAERNGLTGALLFLDLDNFKILNDTKGHDLGDELLIEVGERLRASVRESDTVARLGGDEFVIMLAEVDPDAERAASLAARVCDKLLEIMSEPFRLSRQEYYITPSIGVTLFGPGHGGVEQILKQADLAMYQAKEAGRNQARFFDDHMEQEVAERAARERDLRIGLNDQQFVLFFQPQVTEHKGVTGAEALLRWQHPERGRVSPGEFIPLAEDSGMILELGRFVLHEACRQLVQWSLSPETSELVVSVNVSARQFHHPGFVDDVRQALEETGAKPSKLKLEVTESLLLEDVDDVITKMSALRGDGVGFALDDFGTGYSSLFYLKHLPLDQLKIDQSFVQDVLKDSNDAVIARTIIGLGQSLGLAVIAEGVEEPGQLAFLRENGCTSYQGFYFSYPLPADEFEQLLVQSGGDWVEAATREPGGVSSALDNPEYGTNAAEEPNNEP